MLPLPIDITLYFADAAFMPDAAAAVAAELRATPYAISLFMLMPMRLLDYLLIR